MTRHDAQVVPPVRVHARVAGIVQGVGFRPHAHRLAKELGLAGEVGNDARGVFVAVEGDHDRVEGFLARLVAEAPPLVRIDRIDTEWADPTGATGFAIVASTAGGDRTALVSPDVATCDDCRGEVADPGDRRHRYPFTNCTNCGPRYTIVRDVPYDRVNTTMAGFALCSACQSEYRDPSDRRFHAQPVCCPACGPSVTLLGGSAGGRPERLAEGDDAIRATAERLYTGGVVAVKGLGGYHLAVLASDEAAARRLRSRKHREDKPFAIMVADLAEAARLCEVDTLAADLLALPSRPIVLLPRRPAAPVAAAVAPGNRALGVMLPYTPLHHLLLSEVGGPIVLTSGNRADEPIAYRDEDALTRLGDIADAFLVHDRPIHIRVDDSVVRPMAGRPVPVRRSRGFVPTPVTMPVAARDHVLAVGAELKNTVCLARGDQAFLSHHIGDLENYETYASFLEAIEHLGRLFDIRPTTVAHDLHPEYLSTKYAMDLDDVDLVGIQHHHAHVASCLADNARSEAVIGVAFDGTGFGPDGTIWGGEILLADLRGYERLAHLATVPMPGGAQAVLEPWRMAASHLRDAYGVVPDLDVAARIGDRWDRVLAVAEAGVNSPQTSSAGRLFDAVAAILGVRDAITYEGQAAIELEQVADPRESRAYPFDVERAADGTLRLQPGSLVRAVVHDLADGCPAPTVAAAFHNGVAVGVAEVCHELARSHGVGTVALSGGVFQNVLLTARMVQELDSRGLAVLTHRQVPPNDGGISLGQAAVVAARASGAG